jgi:hypothetical protein
LLFELAQNLREDINPSLHDYKLLSLPLAHFLEISDIGFGGLLDESLFLEHMQLICKLILLFLLALHQHLELSCHLLLFSLTVSALIVKGFLKSLEVVFEHGVVVAHGIGLTVEFLVLNGKLCDEGILIQQFLLLIAQSLL